MVREELKLIDRHLPWHRKTSALGEDDAGSQPHVKSCTPRGFLTNSCGR
jgi:hypothetical protein